MFKLVLAIGLIVICICPETSAQTTNDVVIVAKGQQQALSFTGLTGAAVGDINVIFIHERRLNEVVIIGAGVGKTSLDIFQRGGRKKRLTVLVVSQSLTDTQTLHRIATQALPPLKSLVQKNNVGSSSKSMGGATTAVVPEVTDAAVVASPTDAHSTRLPKERTVAPTPVAQRDKKQTAGRSILSRLEMSAETTVLSDKEQVRVVSAELIEPGKLQEAISADIVERLATSPKREQTMTVRRSSIVTMLTFQYEMSDHNSLTLSVPYIQRRDEIKAGGNSIETGGRGVGDIQMKFERSYPRMRKSAWDGTVEFDLGLPTGKSIYNAATNQSPLGIGHYEVGGVLGARRVFDPLAFNAAVGVSYALPRTIEGVRIAPGFGYQAQTGVAYAVTDRIGITQSLQYTRSPNVFLSTPPDARTVSTNQAYLRHGLVFNPRGGHAVRMMFTMGLNPESLNHGFGVMYSFRRPGKTPE